MTLYDAVMLWLIFHEVSLLAFLMVLDDEMHET